MRKLIRAKDSLHHFDKRKTIFPLMDSKERGK